MRPIRSLLTAGGLVLVMAGAAAAAPITFVDIYDDAATLDRSNTTLSFSHSILAPSEAPPSYNPATDTLVSASLGLLFTDATQGNDYMVVTWSNFNDSLSFSTPELGAGFGNSLDFVIDVSFLENEGILNVLLERGPSSPTGAAFTFLSSTLTVLAERYTDGNGRTVPEPASLTLFALGLVGAGVVARRRSRT